MCQGETEACRWYYRQGYLALSEIESPTPTRRKGNIRRIKARVHNEYDNFESQKKGHDNNKPKKLERFLLYRYYDFIAIVLADGKDLVVIIDVRLP